MLNLQADPLKDQEVRFMFKGEQYKAVFQSKRLYWVIFDSRGVVVPETKGNSELWEHFYYHKQPKENVRALSFFNKR